MTSQPQTASHETTVVPVILGVSLGHFLNDLMQSLIPAAYPLLKDNLALSFTQIGLITLVFQGTASILQPLVGLYTDRRPLPYALSAGMASTGAGLVLLAHAASFAMVLCSVALIGLGSAIFHPEASRIARLAAGMRPGFAQSVFQVGGNAGSALGPLAAAFPCWVWLRSSFPTPATRRIRLKCRAFHLCGPRIPCAKIKALGRTVWNLVISHATFGAHVGWMEGSVGVRNPPFSACRTGTAKIPP